MDEHVRTCTYTCRYVCMRAGMHTCSHAYTYVVQEQEAKTAQQLKRRAAAKHKHARFKKQHQQLQDQLISRQTLMVTLLPQHTNSSSSAFSSSSSASESQEEETQRAITQLTQHITRHLSTKPPRPEGNMICITSSFPFVSLLFDLYHFFFSFRRHFELSILSHFCFFGSGGRRGKVLMDHTHIPLVMGDRYVYSVWCCHAVSF